jgi:hypothetical protein
VDIVAVVAVVAVVVIAAAAATSLVVVDILLFIIVFVGIVFLSESSEFVCSHLHAVVRGMERAQEVDHCYA